MSVRKSLALVAGLLLAALGLLWFLLSEVHIGQSDPALPGPTMDAPDVSGRGTRVSALPSVTPLGSAIEEENATEPEREAVALAKAGSGGFTIPTDAQWIEGRVIFPEGTPPDEALRVEASGQRFTNRRKSPNKHTVHVEPDGRFRVAFGARTTWGKLSLQGRYLYLEENRNVDLKTQIGEVVLEPLLGGAITGAMLLPSGRVTRENVHWRVVLGAQCWDSERGMVRHVTRPARDGSFEIGGLPPGPDYRLDLRSRVFVGQQLPGITVSPGEVTQANPTLIRGVRLAGRVVDEDGKGLKGVGLKVEILVARGRQHPTDWNPARTAEDGTFEFTGLQAGETTLTILVGGEVARVEKMGHLRPGEVRENLHFKVKAGLEITGRVLWPDGTPAVGAAVRAQPVLGEDEDYLRVRRFTGKADSQGNFRFSGLADRPMMVIATARREPPPRATGGGADGAPKRRRRAPDEQPWKGTRMDVLPRTEGLIVILSPGETLRGRVIDDTGAPLTGFRLTAEPRSHKSGWEHLDGPGLIGQTSRDENGRFELTGLDEGVWLIRLVRKGIIVPEPKTVMIPTDAPLELVVVRAARLSGVVVDPRGNPVAGAEVDMDLQRGWTTSTGIRVAITDGEGRFERSDAPVGSLALSANASGWAPSPKLELEGGPGEAHENLLLALRAGARLTGKVHPSEQPLAGRRIVVDGQGDLDFWEGARSDDQGWFSIEGLPPGEFRVTLEPPSDEDPGGDWRLTYARRREVTVTLAEGGSAHVVLGGVHTGAIIVHGRVTVGGREMDGLVVGCSQHDFYAAAIRDELGNYELKLNDPGPHWFSIGRPGGNDAQFRRDIGEEKSQREDFDLPVASIAGTVLGPDGRPATQVFVALDRAEGPAGHGLEVGEQSSDAGGSFRFEFVPPGRYRLRAGGPDWRGKDTGLATTVVDDVVLEEGESLEGLVVELRPGGSITGVVTSSDGGPVKRVWITVKDSSGRLVAGAEVECSLVDGSYVLPGIPAGTFSISGETTTGQSGEVTVRVAVGASSRADLVIVE